MGRLYEMAKSAEITQKNNEKYKALGRFLKVEDFSTTVEAKPKERTANDVRTELAEAERLRDAASKRRSNYSGRGSALMYADGAVAAAMNRQASEAANAEFEKYDARVYALKSELYELENTANRKLLDKDGGASALYDTAQAAGADMEKWAASLLTSPDAGYMEYLAKEYGTDNVLKQFGEIRKRKQSASKELEALGYDYDRMADYEKRTEQRERRAAEQAENKAFAQKHPVLASAATVPVGVFQGIDYLKMTGREIANDLRGENDWRPSYTDDMYLTNFVSDIRGSVSEELEANTDWELLSENVASFLYNTGMSIADCIATISTAGTNAGVLMGGAAAAQTAKTVVESGGTGKQAVVLGLASGAAEMVFEKFSIDNLLKHKDITSAKRLITETLKQGGIEASEEVATEASNILMNTIVMGSQSDFNRTVAFYMSEEGGGMNADEAKQRALKDCMNQVIMAGIGGFISGGVMGGVSGGIQLGVYSHNTAAEHGSDAKSIVAEVLTLDPKNEYAKQMEQKLKNGKKLTGLQIRHLMKDRDRLLSEWGGVEETSEAESPSETMEQLQTEQEEDAGLTVEKYARIVQEAETEQEAFSAAPEKGAARQQETAERAEEIPSVDRNSFGETSDEMNAVQRTPARKLPAKVDSEQTEQTAVPADAMEDDGAEEPVTLEEASKKYGAQAGAMVHTYVQGQDVGQYDAAYQIAYDMGKSGVNLSYAMKSPSTAYLNESQRELAYEAGTAAAKTAADSRQTEIIGAANGKSGRRKGTVRGDGVKIADMKKAFNDPQNKAYKILTGIAEATGIDIVLYRSQANDKGVFEGSQGKFSRNDNAIYIDINAGLTYAKDVNELQKYTMLRTFSHEFTHFIENWNPVRYNEFRKVVFDTLTERGEDVHDLIELKMEQTGLDYDAASREVVAEAMTDILPDASFVEQLAHKHRSIFDKLLERLKEFARALRDYFDSLGHNPSREANALKNQVGDGLRYVESIVKLFDNVAVEAVESYQAANAVEEVVVSKNENTTAETAEPKITTSDNGYTITDNTEFNSIEIKFNEKPSAAVRDVLKNNKFKWNGKKGVWYGKTTHEAIQKELDAVYAGTEEVSDTAPLEPAKQATSEEVKQEPKTEVKKPAVSTDSIYERLKNPLSFQNHFEIGGYRFAVEKLGDSRYVGTVKTHSDEYVSNARGLNYRSGVYEQRDDAIQDIVDVARNNKLLDAIDKTAKPESEIALETDGLNHKAVKEYATQKGYRIEINKLAAKKGMIQVDIYDKNNLPTLGSVIINDISDWYKVKEAIDRREAAENATPIVETPPVVDVNKTASEKLADMVLAEYLNEDNIQNGRKMLTSRELYRLADIAFGGTQAEGAYNRKDAYDALELAVNKFLLGYAAKFNGDVNNAVDAVKFMQGLLELLPTQNVRTQEMEDYQQFSTPPNIAYLAAWAANINSSDFVLEPSAGIGGLAVFAKAWGAEVAVNELSKRRLEVLRAMGFDHLFNENAEQIDNILPDHISPNVVIMNPPFSSTAGRTKNNKTSNAEKHIDQALARLRDGGRLVAILGQGMNDGDYYRYWDKLRREYSIRANLSIDGDNYKKYGTTYGVQLVVIDKTGPQTGNTVTGKFSDLTQVPNVLEGIRNDRQNVEEHRHGSRDDGQRESVADGGNEQSEAGHLGSDERAAGSASDTQRKANRKVSEGTEGAGRRADGKGTAKNSGKAAEGKNGRGVRAAERTDSGNGNAANAAGAADRHQSELSLPRLNQETEVSDDGVYATFVVPKLPVEGGKRHPAVLVESAAMAAVSMPEATYKPHLPADVVKNNLSDAQMVSVTYAGQAHEQLLPDGRRKGFFIGDGTGVGKGRQIAGIILDNFMQGRTKAVWISKNNDLFGDAIRDWTATTGRSKDEVINHSKIKPKDKISLQEGILYSTYDTVKSEKGGNRLDQIVEWLGEDFDGVIAFDEAHNMGNLFGKKGKFGKSKGSEKAKAGVELQRRLPNARIVYVSATAATEVDNLAYAERIGLWGKGTAFNNAQDFIAKIGSSGLAAMELVIRDMKAMGVYVARSISYNGVNYDTVEHALTPMQTEIYNTMSRAWQKTMAGVQSALVSTGGQYNSTQRQRAMGNFYSSMQRFYNQVLTSMSMPSVITDMRRELDAGHSCVLQIVNTNEAQQNKQLAAAKAEGTSLDDLDLTPREALLGYLNTSFPTQMFEEYTDDEGHLRSRPVLDSSGQPVHDKKALRQRDALIEEVNQMSIPDGPLEMLFDAFGTDTVAENTGRSRRVVPKKLPDGSMGRVEERRTLNHRTADVQAFQDGKKRILVFSDAGGTGKSYHADLSEKNQQLRIHYVLQPGWVASNAVQGFGRTHRSNEASAPVYKLVTTNIKGQKRFTSTIARRLDQLGALTKGQRDTGSGMFGAKDNLETDLAKDSLREFYIRLGKNQIEDIDGMKTLDRLGLKQKFTDEFGGFKVNDALARDIGTFLNRILALEVDEQNTIFDAFISIYEMELEAAIQAGTLDTGMENVKADKIEIVDDKIIREADSSGAATHYIQAKTYIRPKVIATVEEMSHRRAGFVGIYKLENDTVRAVFRMADKTTEWGAIQKQYRLVGPNVGANTNVWGERSLQDKAKPVDKAEWQTEWDAEVARVPEYNENTVHMLTGALLPIWNSLPQEGNTKVKRLIASDGSTYLGRVIDNESIDNVLGRFSVGRTLEVFTPQQVMDKAIKEGIKFQLTNNRTQIFRSRVSGEWRLEITQPNSWYLQRNYPGILHEKIQYRDRYFIPVGSKGIETLEKLLKDNPVRNTTQEELTQYQSRYYSEEKYSYEWFVNKPDMVLTVLNDDVPEKRADIVKQAKKNAEAIGKTNSDGGVSVHVNDIDTDVLLGTNGLKHSLDRRTDVNGKVVLRAGEILQNSILLNELTPQNEEVDSTYVLIGAATDDAGQFYVVRSVVNRHSSELATMDVLYAINAKKNRLRSMRPGIQHPVTDSTISISELLDDVNKHFPDVLPESVLKHYGYAARPEGKLGEDALYQQRTNTLTDREVLAIAASEIPVDTLNDGEKDALRIFKSRLDKLEALQLQRAEAGQLYKEQQFGKGTVDRAAAAVTLERMHALDKQIAEAEKAVLTVEDKAVLKRVLQKARKVVEKQQKAQDKVVLDRWRQRRNEAAAIKKYRERIRKDVDTMSKWVLHPNNKNVLHHIPDALKNTVIPFLTSIDFTSKRQLNGGETTQADREFVRQMNAVRDAMQECIDLEGLYSGYSDLPPDFMLRLQKFIDGARTLTESGSGSELLINRMTAAELKELSELVRLLKRYIMDFNRFHANAMYSHVYEAAEDTIGELARMKDAGPYTGGVSNFLFWKQIRPAYAFERFGKGGKAIYDSLRRGQATLAFNTKAIIDYAEQTYTADEVRKWSEEIKTVELDDGSEVKMPVTMMMSFYCLWKRPQGRQHILGQGIRVATYMDGPRKISDNGHLITAADVQAIIGKLTPRQKDVADKLQKYMAEQGGKWGNHVTVARFGEELFGEEHYFPINSDGRHLQATADEQPGAASLYALLNMGFTKELNEEANNRIILYNIFDVFSNHMASMAQYNAFALPVLDALKWFNYRQRDVQTKEVTDSVRDEMSRVYGAPEESKPGSGRRGYAEAFVINVIKAFNGTEAQGSPNDGPPLQMLHRYNMAQVAFNSRVILQQPLAITRAALLISPVSIARGLKLSPAAIGKNIDEMRSHSGIAAWKALGFYDVNISRGVTALIKHDESFMDKVSDIGMKGAELADTVTWAAMWAACKEEVIHNRGLTPKREGFYEAVTELFEDVVYKTQVVDSVLTKNEYMRDKGFGARMMSSFMSEPTTTASMLLDAYDKFCGDMRRGMSRQQAWKKNGGRIARTVAVYAVGGVLLAAVQAVADAWRDDDDYQTFMEKVLEAFKGNVFDELNPLGKLPIVSEVVEFAKELLAAGGFDAYGQMSNLPFADVASYLIQATEILFDKLLGEKTNYTWYAVVYKYLQGFSGLTGLPMASFTREVVDIWNHTIGAMAPSLKCKTYEPGGAAQIRYAYEDGWLTAEEAATELLDKGFVDTEDEAYWKMQGWEAGDDFSKYDALDNAVRSMSGITEEMRELTEHGVKEKDAVSHIKSSVGEWYREGEVSKKQAMSMLQRYCDMSSDEALATVQYWSFKKSNSDTDVDEAWLKRYYEDIESTGIAVETYVDYRSRVRSITGEGMKQRRMAVIDSLPITDAQKDALYYAEGWAASTIDDAPWH